LIRQCSEKWDYFERFIDEENHEDLHRVYSLLARIPESVKILQDKFEKHARRAGQLAISKLVGEDDLNAVEARVYVTTLLEVYQKYHSIVQRSFKSETTLLRALDRACRDFVNNNAVTRATRSSQLLAIHASNLLLKSNRSFEEVELEDALDQVVSEICERCCQVMLEHALLDDSA
jgi:cullin 1